MNQKLTPSTILLLIVPPLLWAGNAVVGRLISDMIPPITLNFIRWTIALLILLPLGRSIFRPGSGLAKHWRRYALLGLLGIGLYNTLQYMALHTSTALNVTLVAASLPVWILITGRIFFNTPIRGYQLLGGIVSISGVLIVLSHGDWRQLMELRLVIGDVFMIIATIVWAFYSWMLTKANDDPEIRNNWATFLLAQVVYGLVWSGMFTASEWVLTDAEILWSWPLALALLYVAVGPAIVAFRCWGAGVQRVGPAIAGFFNNLTPLIAALMSLAFLGELPQLYHAAAFVCIVGGIILSTQQTKT
ncbi:DMT family transporter [Alcaligenaceae bacterium]|nr:DMT family transporter [Alcaligenaceae bacterium]